MTDTNTSRGALDELVSQLLACGAVTSRLIAGMIEFEASGRSAPDAPPIPEVAHALIRSVLPKVARRYSESQLETAAAIVDQVTELICSEIYIVSPDLN